MYFLNKKTILNILFFLLILSLIFYREPCFLLDGTFQGDEIVFFKILFSLVKFINEFNGILFFFLGFSFNFLIFGLFFFCKVVN